MGDRSVGLQLLPLPLNLLPLVLVCIAILLFAVSLYCRVSSLRTGTQPPSPPGPLPRPASSDLMSVR
jgi:hypothetical protein